MKMAIWLSHLKAIRINTCENESATCEGSAVDQCNGAYRIVEQIDSVTTVRTLCGASLEHDDRTVVTHKLQNPIRRHCSRVRRWPEQQRYQHTAAHGSNHPHTMLTNQTNSQLAPVVQLRSVFDSGSVGID